jgi:putative proteasome-type protease
MTYCVGVLLESGLVFASDSRTNAGVDQVATFPKMNVFEVPGERVLVIMTAGNLAITQAVLQHLRQAIAAGDGEHLHNVNTMFDAAKVVGDAVRAVYARDAEHLKNLGTEFTASLLLGGQIGKEAPQLFSIYSAGNFIQACQQTPFFQIGESKYGKPILDRVVRWKSGLEETLKCVLISFDSTIRSNVSVAPPIDVLVYHADSLKVDSRHRVMEDDPYFLAVRKSWGEGLRKVFAETPNPDWF